MIHKKNFVYQKPILSWPDISFNNFLIKTKLSTFNIANTNILYQKPPRIRSNAKTKTPPNEKTLTRNKKKPHMIPFLPLPEDMRKRTWKDTTDHKKHTHTHKNHHRSNCKFVHFAPANFEERSVAQPPTSHGRDDCNDDDDDDDDDSVSHGAMINCWTHRKESTDF